MHVNGPKLTHALVTSAAMLPHRGAAFISGRKT